MNILSLSQIADDPVDDSNMDVFPSMDANVWPMVLENPYELPVESLNNGLSAFELNELMAEQAGLSDTLSDTTLIPLAQLPIEPKASKRFLRSWMLLPRLVPVDEQAKFGQVWVAVAGTLVTGDGQACNPLQFWSSSFICQRLSNQTLSSTSGTCYVLLGPSNESEMAARGFSESICSQFKDGFPMNWKNLLNHACAVGSPLYSRLVAELETSCPDQTDQGQPCTLSNVNSNVKSNVNTPPGRGLGSTARAFSAKRSTDTNLIIENVAKVPEGATGKDDLSKVYKDESVIVSNAANKIQDSFDSLVETVAKLSEVLSTDKEEIAPITSTNPTNKIHDSSDDELIHPPAKMSEGPTEDECLDKIAPCTSTRTKNKIQDSSDDEDELIYPSAKKSKRKRMILSDDDEPYIKKKDARRKSVPLLSGSDTLCIGPDYPIAPKLTRSGRTIMKPLEYWNSSQRIVYIHSSKGDTPILLTGSARIPE